MADTCHRYSGSGDAGATGNWISFADNGKWLFARYPKESDAMLVRLVEHGDMTFKMENVGFGQAGNWVSFTNDGAWLRAVYNERDAVPLRLGRPIGWTSPPPMDNQQWEPVQTPDGQTYYWNRATNETRWEPPPSSAPSRPVLQARLDADLNRVAGTPSPGSNQVEELYELCLSRVSELATNVQEGRVQGPGNQDKMVLLQWQLLHELGGEAREKVSRSVHWPDLINNELLLEMFLSSGQCGLSTGDTPQARGDRWLNACNILFDIIARDCQAANPASIVSRIGIACALTFHTPESIRPGHHFGPSLAPPTDPVQRFEYFRDVHARGELYGTFDQSTAWHMRYVVGASMTDQDMDWCRANVPAEYRDRDKVGEAGHSRMEYKKNNHTTGASIFGDEFYDGKLITVQLLWEYGGVCGCNSRAGAAMAQANGVPAMPVGAPGHCAYLWQIRPGEWHLSYAATATWGNCTRHTPYQMPFNSQNGLMVQMMELCQASPESFSQSERVRVLAEQLDIRVRGQQLIYATNLCPFNMSIWQALLQLLDDAWKIGHDVSNDSWVQHARESVGTAGLDEEVISSLKPVSASTQDRASNIVDITDSEWYERAEHGWIEIDLEGSCDVNAIEIQWWGVSVADEYTILSRSSSQGQGFTRRKTQNDASENPTGGYNQWSKLTGWEASTSHIRIELSGGHEDPWGMNVLFGIRQVNVIGIRNIVSHNMTPAKCIVARFEQLMRNHLRLGGVSAAVAWYQTEVDTTIGKHVGELSAAPIMELQQPGDMGIRVSDDSLRPATNLVDGTESEWWTKHHRAWIEIDLGQMCTVTAVEIKWWGNSVAKQLELLSSHDGGRTFTTRRTEQDDAEQRHTNPGIVHAKFVVSQTRCALLGCNDWTKIRGFNQMADTVRLELGDGTASMWDSTLLFGIRNIKVIGRKGHRRFRE